MSGGRDANPIPAFPRGSDPEALFRIHAPWLLGALRRRYGRDLAEDLVQDTYLRLLRLSDPVEIRSPKAFLLQVARNLFLTRVARDKRRLELETPYFETQARTQASEQVELLILKEIILGMPRKQRDVFVLSRFAGMTNDAIAEHLGIQPKTVEWRMTKALAYCAGELRNASDGT
ncbi:sigma-70 family RNA polymerase sigma factor [soil metagenome]